MAYSTGRGGAGNIHKSSEIKSPRLTPQLSNKLTPQGSNKLTNLVSPPQHADADHKVFYSTGRGGAGNMQSSSTIPSPQLVPQGLNTPQLSSPIISTGRGGYGNMVNNKDPELTRKLQDVDRPRDASPDLYAVASNKSFSVGRGGFGNVISQTNTSNSQKSSGLEKNGLYTISSHGNKKDKTKKKGFFGKIKEVFNASDEK